MPPGLSTRRKAISVPIGSSQCSMKWLATTKSWLDPGRLDRRSPSSTMSGATSGLSASSG